MLVNEFDELMETQPFRPFTLVSADGRSTPVKSPEFAWRVPNSMRTVVVATDEPDVIRWIDLQHVTQVLVGRARNGTARRKKS